MAKPYNVVRLSDKPDYKGEAFDVSHDTMQLPGKGRGTPFNFILK
jgi:hypothetical protein